MPPLPTAARPASNCGLTSATSQAPGAARLSAAGRAKVRLMKLTSATMAVTSSPITGDRGALASVPSRATTLGLTLSLAWSWPAADIHGVDFGRAAGDQHVGEAPGRGADIERHPPLGVEAEGVERRRELDPAARNVGAALRGSRRSSASGADQHARLQRRHTRHAHQPAPDEVGGAGARRRQAPLHQ